MGQRFAEPKSKIPHDWLALVPKNNVYARYVSDLAGYDPKQVDLIPDAIVPAVMSWLCIRQDAIAKSSMRCQSLFRQRRNVVRNGEGTNHGQGLCKRLCGLENRPA